MGQSHWDSAQDRAAALEGSCVGVAGGEQGQLKQCRALGRGCGVSHVRLCFQQANGTHSPSMGILVCAGSCPSSVRGVGPFSNLAGAGITAPLPVPSTAPMGRQLAPLATLLPSGPSSAGCPCSPCRRGCGLEAMSMPAPAPSTELVGYEEHGPSPVSMLGVTPSGCMSARCKLVRGGSASAL